MFPYTAAKFTLVTDDPHFFKSKTKAAVYSKVHDSWGGFSAGAEEDLKLRELAPCNDRLVVRKVLTGMLDLGGNFSGWIVAFKTSLFVLIFLLTQEFLKKCWEWWSQWSLNFKLQEDSEGDNVSKDVDDDENGTDEPENMADDYRTEGAAREEIEDGEEKDESSDTDEREGKTSVGM